jgi:hypothetical protein
VPLPTREHITLHRARQHSHRGWSSLRSRSCCLREQPIRSLLPKYALLMVGLVARVTPAAAQGNDPGCPEAGDRTCGAVSKVTPAAARSMLSQLENLPDSQWHVVLRGYFRELYNKDFLDWIVFIRKDGTSRQALFAKGKVVKDNIVRGHQSLALLVFSESTFEREAPDSIARKAALVEEQKADSVRQVRLATMARQCQAAGISCTVTLTYAADETKPGGAGDGGGAATKIPGELALSRTTLQYTRDPGLIALLKGLTAGVVGPAADAAAVPDSLVDVKLDDVIIDRAPDDSTRFYFGYRRIHLPINALTRFTLRPNRDRKIDFPRTTTISRTIENASQQPFRASLGTGLTVNAPDSTFAIADTGRSLVVSTSSKVKPRVWVMAHVALIRPQLPIRPQDLTLLVGTNLSTSDLFRDLLLGVGVGSLIGDVGIVGGINFIQRQSADSIEGAGGRIVGLRTRDYRRARAFVGLDFAL